VVRWNMRRQSRLRRYHGDEHGVSALSEAGYLDGLIYEGERVEEFRLRRKSRGHIR